MVFFPFEVTYDGSAMTIAKNLSIDPEIPENAEILSINKVRVSKVIETLEAHIIGDGKSNVAIEHTVSRYFPMAYSNFFENPNRFEIQLRAPDIDEIKIVEITALTLAEIERYRNERYPKATPTTDDKVLKFETIAQENMGYLTIRSFNKAVLKRSNQDFESFIDSTFQEIHDQKIKDLVIDLRSNSGGWTAYGNYLFSHFSGPGIPYIASVEFLKTDNFTFAPIQATGTEITDTMVFEPLPSGRLRWKNYPSSTSRENVAQVYKGNTYIAVDGMTRSCSNVFASLMRQNTQAVLIGTETGGAQGGSGGFVVSIELPYTGIKTHFSTAEYEYALKGNRVDQGVLPDLPIPYASLQQMDAYEILDFIKTQVGGE